MSGSAQEHLLLPADWGAVLADTLSSERYAALTEFVARERQASAVYPPPEQVFRAFELTPYEDVRVVILGQDPYHGPGQAHGLAFSVAEGTLPPSLRKIVGALESDLGLRPAQAGNLEPWARQGVLLLNTVLTVRAGEPNSHAGRGWEEFTDQVIRAVNDKTDSVVFLLWGGPAMKKKNLISSPPHHVITSAHPAARPDARNPIATSESFSRANRALQDAGRSPIQWGIPVQPLPG